MTLAVPTEGIDPSKTREAVKAYCRLHNITTDRLALILELNNEVYQAFMSGNFARDGRLTEMFMLLYWVCGLDKADPVLYGVPQDQVSAWGTAKAEYIVSKRRELYRVQQTAAYENVKSEVHGAVYMFVMCSTITVACVLLGMMFNEDLLFQIAFLFGIFTAVFGGMWVSAQSTLKKL